MLRKGLKPDENERTLIAKAIQDAVQEADIYKWTKEIINSRNLKNPQELFKTLDNAVTQSDRAAQKGNILELELAAKLAAREKSSIFLEKGADILDVKNKVAWQVKNTDGTGIKALSSNLKEAANQLKGKSNEIVPDGYKRHIYTRISNPGNPGYKMTPQQLEKFIQEKLASSIKEVDQVQIDINSKTHVFEIKNGVFKYTKTYSQDRLLSDENINLNNPVVTAQKTRLLEALKNYQMASTINSPTNKLEAPLIGNRSSSNTNLALARIQLNLYEINKYKEADAAQAKNPPQPKVEMSKVNSRNIDRGL
jgi:hypothetical protein